MIEVADERSVLWDQGDTLYAYAAAGIPGNRVVRVDCQEVITYGHPGPHPRYDHATYHAAATFRPGEEVSLALLRRDGTPETVSPPRPIPVDALFHGLGPVGP